MATGSMSKGPGKSYREGLSLDRLFRMFPTDEAAEAWFTAERWPDGPYCPHCGSRNIQPSSYQPSKAEMEEDIGIDTTPEDLLRAVVCDVRIEYDENA